MIGRTISHYRIVREVGAGGMGVVFAAEDVRLGRQVAIKFVPDGLADDRQLFERLRSEARTASALNHPNICTLYDIGDHEGRPFLVMELLQGRTLRDRLMAGPLKTEQTLDIGIQVSDALDVAHRGHIIHRDIKPANLFLNERGSIKILDFGLAKFVSHQATSATMAPTDLTTAGMALGTVAYMSPEQVTGEALDGRSDIFSFGVVLYECVTGHQPFKGKTSGVILSEILNRTPPPPLTFNPDLPLRLQEIIVNCLEKDRELRYQDSAALRTDLKRLKRDLESSGARTVSRINVPIDAASSNTQTISVSTPQTAAASSRGRRGWIAGAIAPAAVVAAAAAAFFMFRTSTAPQKDAAESVSAPVQKTDKAVDDVRQSQASAEPSPAPASRSAAPVVARKDEAKGEPVRPSVTPAPARAIPAAPTQIPETTSPTAGLPAPPPLPVVVPPAPQPTSQPAAQPTPVASAPAPPPPVEAPKPSPASTVQAAPPPTPAAAPEDDDAVIRRVIAAYARAIEAKDLDAFRSVKPNLSPAEQRRLEDSFRAGSQKVDITVLSIERRGPSAAAKVRRRDTLTAGGRSQTSETQQTMTLVRSGAGWVITEIH